MLCLYTGRKGNDTTGSGHAVKLSESEAEGLDALCEDLDLNREDILEKMKQINYTYDEENNRFV